MTGRMMTLIAALAAAPLVAAQPAPPALKDLPPPSPAAQAPAGAAATPAAAAAPAKPPQPDLSDLLRASLSTTRNRTSLKEELEVTAIYQRIEKLRLGDRLQIRWDIEELPMRARIPSLTIQPLVENAIYHGIELLPEGGEILISGKRDGRYLQITVSNPVAPGKSRDKIGNNMAMSNIRQRFELAYGSRASVEIDSSDNRFVVALRFPVDEDAQ